MQALRTEVGRLEGDVRDIKSQINQMAKSHEVHQISSNVDSLERTVREIGSALFDGFRYELETLREEIRQLREEVIPELN